MWEQKQKRGFTLIELLVVITVMGILLSIGLFSQRDLQNYSADNERADDVASIARRLEQAYNNQEIGSPSYPSTSELLSDIGSGTRTMKGVNVDAFTPPGRDGPTVLPALTGANADLYPVPTTTTYVYQALKSNGDICAGNPSNVPASENCVKFKIYYRTDIGKAIKSVASMHQQ